MARKILLADDSVTAQNMGRKILADAGYEVIAVNNGSAALKKIAELKPDLVVLDVYMPGYSGLEVCQRLKESPETSRIPVLLTVGKLEPFKPEEAKRAGAEAFIVKPFEASELLSALSKLEDKVVPRSESSKPGRFARAIAAVEDSGSGRAKPGEDNGWKSRIALPHKKSEAEQELAKKFEEQPPAYNPLNRDLRTLVETPAEKADHTRQEQSSREPATLDVAALAPSSVSAALPKDATAEEVAAITAAAAQMQSLAARVDEEFGTSESATQAHPETDTTGFEPPIREIDLEAAPAASDAAASLKTGEPPVEEAAQDRDVPVTMAATADSVSSSGASRWTAVAVALEDGEASLSLESEMQAAHSSAQAANAGPVNTDDASPVPVLSPSDAANYAGQAPVEESAVRQAESVPQPEPLPQPEPAAVSPAAESETLSASHLDTDSIRSDFAEETASAVGAFTQESPRQEETNSFASQAEPSAACDQPAETSHSVPFRVPDRFSSTPPEDAQAESQASSAFAEPEPASPYASAPQDFEPAPFDIAPPVTPYSVLSEPNPVDESNPKPESEAVKSTAAAWASWRQVRDNHKSDEAPQDQNADDQQRDDQQRNDQYRNLLPSPSASEPNAAAVAAGAEQAPPSAANHEEPGDVASIVDSVLANLRPKLMAEISRKMSENKSSEKK